MDLQMLILPIDLSERMAVSFMIAEDSSRRPNVCIEK